MNRDFQRNNNQDFALVQLSNPSLSKIVPIRPQLFDSFEQFSNENALNLEAIIDETLRLDKKVIIVFDAPKGAGKTQFIEKSISYLKKKIEDLGILSITHSRAMIDKACADFNIAADIDAAADSKQVAGTVNQIHGRYQHRLMRATQGAFNVLILDELSKSLEATASTNSTIDKKFREKTYNRLSDYAHNANIIFVADADLSEAESLFLAQMSGHHLIHCALPQTQYPPKDVTILEHDNSHYIGQAALASIEKDLQEGKKIYVFTDDKKLSRLLYAKAQKLLDKSKIIYLTKERRELLTNKEVLKNIDSAITQRDIGVLITTPVIDGPCCKNNLIQSLLIIERLL